MTFEEAVSRCWAEIDLDVILGNYERARAMAGEAGVICVLKGNAYGMGAAAVGPALMSRGARRFAVASGDEAEELAQACPGADILVLGQVGEEQAVRLIGLGAAMTVFDARSAGTLSRAARRAGRAARVHVKADTGMYRLGFPAPGAAAEIAALLGPGELEPVGLFTHLALHDRQSDELQFARFDALIRDLAGRGVRFDCVHAVDSIGMVRYPDRYYDAVRIGAWLYGVTPARYERREDCRLCASLKARVAQIHDVAAGERIGYDDTHFLDRDSRIATLTCGYLDGVPRLNSTGEVELRGRRAPVKGLVCMDQMMVDVTDIPEAAPGDEVTLLGGGISLEEFAAWGRLNRNEALGRFGRRVTRIYRLDGRTALYNEVRDGKKGMLAYEDR